MAVITFLLLLVVVGVIVGAAVIGSQYFNYRTNARLDELKEKKTELRAANKALNVARSSLAKVGNDYSHNPQLEALQALDTINELVYNDESN